MSEPKQPSNVPPAPTVLMFAPEHWGAVQRFTRLYSGTYKLPVQVAANLQGASGQFTRADVLRNVAIRSTTRLEEDHRELMANGFSHADGARELAALIEAAILALYSSLDCGRAVVSHIYKNYSGIAASTRKTFKNAADGKLDLRLPQPVRDAFCRAKWYPGLMELRDALTHGEPGNCALDTETRKLMYFHRSVRGTHIPDVFAVLDDYFTHVNQFLAKIFTALLATLNDAEVRVPCGIFGGRLYERMVHAQPAMTFDSGRCLSHAWFDVPGAARCPFVGRCGAYERRTANEPETGS